jgi:hypothetical protein
MWMEKCKSFEYLMIETELHLAAGDTGHAIST